MEIERSAASVEEAIEAALAELGLSEQEVRIEVVQEPRGGFLGLNAQQAVVRVRPIERATPVPEEADEAAEASAAGDDAEAGARDEDMDDLDDQADAAADFLEGLFDVMDLDAVVEFTYEEGTMYVDVLGNGPEEEMGLLIGKHGLTLDGLQELVRTAVQRATGMRCRVLVDVEDYRKRRRAQLVRRAREAGRRVRSTGKPMTLEPMSSYERKVIHDAIAEIAGVDSASEGEEPDRKVVLRPGAAQRL